MASKPVIGSLDDAALLREEARAADAVVNAASSDHRGAVEALLAGLAGSGKAFIHSSGSSIVADLAMGEPSDRIFHEGEPIAPVADKAARVAIDRLVLAAPGVSAVVLCNTMIYGDADSWGRRRRACRSPRWCARPRRRASCAISGAA